MVLPEVVHYTFQGFLANKLRAGLTMLGMAIGTASIILVVTISLTGRDYILQQIQGVGSNLIYLYYEAGGTISGSHTLHDDLTVDDLHAIERLPGVASATGILVNHDRLMLQSREREVAVIGTTQDYFRVRNIRMLSGQFFDASDERSFNKVCVLTEDLARNLFGTLDVRGRSLRLFQVRFAALGVFREGVETFGTSEVSAYSVLMPLSVMNQFTATDKLDLIYASAQSPALVSLLTDRIEALLQARHRPGTSYRVENLAEILNAAGKIAAALTIVLFLVGAISLIISGIGIMNIMLVTVTDRTDEIGLKMAVGARRRAILRQFLAEAVLLSGIGGAAGVLAGVSASLLTRAVTGLDIPVVWSAVVLAFMLSLTVGITFGLLPANRAAKLNPTEALRHE